MGWPGPGSRQSWGRPGPAQGDSPSLATSPMGTLCFWAMYPRKEKTTKPEEKLVRELTEVVMTASLGDETAPPRAAAVLTYRVWGRWLWRGAFPEGPCQPLHGLYRRQPGARGGGTLG